MSVGQRLFAFALTHWRPAVLQLCLAISGTALGFVFPGVMQWFIDDILPNKKSELIVKAVGLAFAAYFGREVLFYFRTRVNSWFEQLMVFDLRAQVHRKIAHMPMSWFDQQSSADILTRLSDDVPATQRVILEGIEQGVTAVMQIIVAAVMMFYTNVPLAWLTLLPTPLLAAGGWIYARLLSPRATRAREAGSVMNAMLFDTIAGIRQIKSYTFEDQQQEHFNDRSRSLQHVQKQLMSAAALYGPLMTFLGNMGLVLVLGFGSWWCIHGAPGGTTLTAGQLMNFIFLVGLLYEPIARLHGVNQSMVTGMAAAKRVFAVLDEVGDEDLREGCELVRPQAHIRFEDLRFSYHGRSPVLHGVNVEAKPQQTIAIVGGTGSGKSTLFQLLTRFYTPTGGRISIDGIDIAELSRESLRDQIGYVTQEAFLFAGTVRDNLLLGKPQASEEELWKALRSACAEEFVQRLDHGLDEHVGERGSKLSGGERQRLAIARAFLKDAPILLLDEATSAVDNRSEQLIQQALSELRVNRTCLIIAHRLSTVIEADQIYVLQHGHVLEHGTHEELLTKCPTYAELAALAFGEK
jgi:ABC-type multidrug transport system fused ATPase/permease subunit